MDAASDSHNKIKLASFVGDVGMLSSSTTETSRHKPRPCSVFVKKLLTVDNSDASISENLLKGRQRSPTALGDDRQISAIVPDEDIAKL